MKTDALPRSPLKAARLSVAGQELLVFREPLAPSGEGEHGLSVHEEEAIALLLEGLSLEEVARRRATEVRSVVRLVDSACRKLGVDSRPARRPHARARHAGMRKVAS